MIKVETMKAKPSALLGIVHQVLDSEVDAPPEGSTEHRALAGFVGALLLDDHLESWPELDAVRAVCETPMPDPVPEPLRLPPPLFDDRALFDFWQRAYLTALDGLMMGEAFSEEHLARIDVLAETTASLATHSLLVLSRKGRLGDRMVDMGRLALRAREGQQ